MRAFFYSTSQPEAIKPQRRSRTLRSFSVVGLLRRIPRDTIDFKLLSAS